MRSAPFGVRLKKTLMTVVAAFIIGGIIAGIGSALEWSWLMWTGAVIGVLLLGLGMATIFTLRIGTCPYCHQELGRTSDVDLSSRDDQAQVECPTCCSWLISDKETLRAYTAADVKEDTTFRCKVMNQGTWPHECLVCGAPPTRYIELKNTKLNAGKLLAGMVSVSWGSLKNAPYCDLHSDAVKLEIEDKELFLKFPDFEMMRRYQHVNYHRFMTGQHPQA